MVDWQRDDTVVLYRAPVTDTPPDDQYAAAARAMLHALDLQIPKPKVTLKPNVVWGVAPDSGISVHPAFLRGVIDHLTNTGIAADRIAIAEGGGTEDHRDMAAHYAAVGYDVLAHETGIRLVDLNQDDFVRVPIPEGRVFDSMPIGQTIYDPDSFFLNIPKMRTHNFAITTLSIKALQGIVVPIEERHMCTLFPRHPGDRGGNGLDSSVIDTHERWAHKICDIALARKPDLNLVDGVVGRDGTGFRRGNNRVLGLVLAGVNQAAVDTIGTYLMGFDPSAITYLRVAGERGMGPTRVEDIRVLVVDDGELVERRNIRDYLTSPPLVVTLSATLAYQTYEPVPYGGTDIEDVHRRSAAS